MHNNGYLVFLSTEHESHTELLLPDPLSPGQLGVLVTCSLQMREWRYRQNSHFRQDLVAETELNPNLTVEVHIFKSSIASQTSEGSVCPQGRLAGNSIKSHLSRTAACDMECKHECSYTSSQRVHRIPTEMVVPMNQSTFSLKNTVL